MPPFEPRSVMILPRTLDRAFSFCFASMRATASSTRSFCTGLSKYSAQPARIAAIIRCGSEEADTPNI